MLQYTKEGWPSELPENLKTYHRHYTEFSSEGGCLLRGMRVVIPEIYQPKVLQELHVSHPGVVQMKGIARSRVWWPGIDQDIESAVASCEACQGSRANPPAVTLHPWVWPSGPWDRIHVDFAGPFMNSMFLIVVDAYSKWVEVVPMSVTSTSKTIEVLREMLARYGLPRVLVSDNGPQFTSQEFDKWIQSNGIKHLRGAPYHPQSNGEAERFVQTFKRSLKKDQGGKGNLRQKLDRFLLVNHIAPNSTTGISLAELFMGRQLQTRMDLWRSSVRDHVEKQQNKQLEYHTRKECTREFQVG